MCLQLQTWMPALYYSQYCTPQLLRASMPALYYLRYFTRLELRTCMPAPYYLQYSTPLLLHASMPALYYLPYFACLELQARMPALYYLQYSMPLLLRARVRQEYKQARDRADAPQTARRKFRFVTLVLTSVTKRRPHTSTYLPRSYSHVIIKGL